MTKNDVLDFLIETAEQRLKLKREELDVYRKNMELMVNDSNSSIALNMANRGRLFAQTYGELTELEYFLTLMKGINIHKETRGRKRKAEKGEENV